MPDVVFRTSLICGLPGEGEAEFEELCEFLREFRQERAGAFVFSPEEGTPAAAMPRPDDDTARRRVELLRFIRPERRFGSVEELFRQIGDDRREVCGGGGEPLDPR